MITGKELKTTTDLVKSVLAKYPEARNSDNYLYLKVVQIIGSKNNINISEMPLSSFLLRMKDLGFPGFESVRRSRQKLQATYPELASCSEVEAQRILNEEVYRDYSRQVC